MVWIASDRKTDKQMLDLKIYANGDLGLLHNAMGLAACECVEKCHDHVTTANIKKHMDNIRKAKPDVNT